MCVACAHAAVQRGGRSRVGGTPACAAPLASHPYLNLNPLLCRQELIVEREAGEAGGEWELVELFGGHLLTKAEGGPLRIRDVVTGAVRCGEPGLAENALCGRAGKPGRSLRGQPLGRPQPLADKRHDMMLAWVGGSCRQR